MGIIKGVNFWSFLFASQMGGWVMVILDEVYAKWFGLFGLFPGVKNPGWLFHHQVDSILFAIPLVLPYIWNRLPGPGLIKGLIYGLLWHIFVFIVSIIGSIGGAAWFQQPMPLSAQASLLILHLAWGD